MDKHLIFGALSSVVIILSRKTILKVRSHGFYRFFSWECISWLLASNYKFWFDHPLCARQVFS